MKNSCVVVVDDDCNKQCKLNQSAQVVRKTQPCNLRLLVSVQDKFNFLIKSLLNTLHSDETNEIKYKPSFHNPQKLTQLEGTYSRLTAADICCVHIQFIAVFYKLYLLSSRACFSCFTIGDEHGAKL